MEYSGDNFFKSKQHTFISSSSICNLFFGRAHTTLRLFFFTFSISHLFSSRLALPPTTATCFVSLALRRREKSKIYYIFNLNACCCYDFIFRSSQSACVICTIPSSSQPCHIASCFHRPVRDLLIVSASKQSSLPAISIFVELFSHGRVMQKKKKKKLATTTTVMMMTMRNLKFKYNFTWSRHVRLTLKVRRCWHQTMQSCHQTIDSFMSSPQLSSSYYAGINDRLCMLQFLHTRAALLTSELRTFYVVTDTVLYQQQCRSFKWIVWISDVLFRLTHVVICCCWWVRLVSVK